MFRLYLFFLLFILFPASVQAAEKDVHVLTISGAISPAYADYLKYGLKTAKEENAQLVIVEMDTPGGLLTSTRVMVSDILESEVPVAVYVTPSGAHAASAGTFILMSAHIAAMDSGTQVGAATPVQMGEGIPMPDRDPSKKDKASEAESAEDQNAKAISEKVMNDTKAFIRSIANVRGRNAEWAEKAVTDADSITSEEALKMDVIDLVAENREDLLEQMNGRVVTLENGEEVALDTENARIVEKKPDPITRFLAFISDPNVAAILMMIGIYGLLLEFYAPGSLVPGTIGAISLMLALYAFSILPVTGLGAMLLLFACLFMIAEIFIPSFGILGIAGVVAMTIGLAVFFDSAAMPGLDLQWQVIIGIVLSASTLMGIAFLLFVKTAIDKEVSSGPEMMIGSEANVVEWGEADEGYVFIEGERWQAYTKEGEGPYTKDDKVLVGAIDGLKLKVGKVD